MRFLNDEDEKIVKNLIRGRMKGGIIFLLLVTLVLGLMFLQVFFAIAILNHLLFLIL